jgi:hypothetical protein
MSIDGRSRLGRRVADLAEDFAQRLGGWASLSDTMTANIRRAAELSALAEEVRANALRDGNIDPIGVVRLEGAASRAVRALQLDRPREPAPMSIEEHLAAYGAVEPRQAREPSGRGVAAPSPRNATYGQTSHRQRASCATTSTSDDGRPLAKAVTPVPAIQRGAWVR